MAKFSGEETSRAAVLEALIEGHGELVAGAALSQRLGMTRQAVFKLIGALKAEGLPVISEPQKGYMLGDLEEMDGISPTLVEYYLRGIPIFNRCLYFSEIDSTQKPIKKLALDDAPEGIIAVADTQTGGRGRRGRYWSSAAGENLTFSTLLRPQLRPSEVQLLNLAAGMAVKESLIELTGIPAELKWPNDILCRGRKICGILSEAAGEPDRVYYAVTGIGINVNMPESSMAPEIASIATSCLIETGRRLPRWRLLTAVLQRFGELMDLLSSRGGAPKLISLYRMSCDTLGQEIRVEQDEKIYTGRAVGVADDGSLRVLTDDGEKTFAAADVHHLRMAERRQA